MNISSHNVQNMLNGPRTNGNTFKTLLEKQLTSVEDLLNVNAVFIFLWLPAGSSKRENKVKKIFNVFVLLSFSFCKIYMHKFKNDMRQRNEHWTLLFIYQRFNSQRPKNGQYGFIKTFDKLSFFRVTLIWYHKKILCFSITNTFVDF